MFAVLSFVFKIQLTRAFFFADFFKSVQIFVVAVFARKSFYYMTFLFSQKNENKFFRLQWYFLSAFCLGYWADSQRLPFDKPYQICFDSRAWHWSLVTLVNLSPVLNQNLHFLGVVKRSPCMCRAKRLRTCT